MVEGSIPHRATGASHPLRGPGSRAPFREPSEGSLGGGAARSAARTCARCRICRRITSSNSLGPSCPFSSHRAPSWPPPSRPAELRLRPTFPPRARVRSAHAHVRMRARTRTQKKPFIEKRTSRRTSTCPHWTPQVPSNPASMRSGTCPRARHARHARTPAHTHPHTHAEAPQSPHHHHHRTHTHTARTRAPQTCTAPSPLLGLHRRCRQRGEWGEEGQAPEGGGGTGTTG